LGQPECGTSIQALGGFSISEELNMAGSADPVSAVQHYIDAFNNTDVKSMAAMCRGGTRALYCI
jgi:hypothetical protein